MPPFAGSPAESTSAKVPKDPATRHDAGCGVFAYAQPGACHDPQGVGNGTARPGDRENGVVTVRLPPAQHPLPTTPANLGLLGLAAALCRAKRSCRLTVQDMI
ncbi:hypothetical protein GCM10009574_074920 [Streptomyces asiaticus]|uniref:PEP-CTERM sorting domain-containing protein n=2 Tax=Streptomyces rhizosphaericus TaxID=114699 RepID=A0ABP4CXN6_9ACTN